MSKEMKDSGVEWIGLVPQDWDRRRLKDIAILAGRIGWQGLTSEEYKDEGPYLITGVDFTNGDIDWNSCVHIEHKRWLEATNVRINNGDLLITKDGTVGKVAMCSGLDGLASLNSGIMVVRPKVSWDKRFMYWLLQSNVFWGWFNDINAGNSTITHLYQRDFYNFFFFLPSSKKVQALIANKLDGLIEKVDQAVSLLQQQIEALEAYKKSLIHEAVTKGLDASAPMKDSGIDWIGQIPAHWTLNPLKSLCLLKTGQTPPSNDLSFYDGDIPWYTPGDINNAPVADSNRTLTYKAVQSEKAPFIQKESVLLVCIGTVGKSGYTQGFCSFNQQITALTPKGEDLAKWLFYAVQNLARVMKSLALYSTIPILNNLFLSGFKVPTPPVEEQQQIAAYLDERCTSLDRALELKREQLELLKQQRQSLIFEYVTGKRRVGQEQ